MTNIEKLTLGTPSRKKSETRQDLLLVAFINANGVDAIVNEQDWGDKCNRGCAFEPCITKKQVKLYNDGFDGYYKGEKVEIKYLTPKTSATSTTETECKSYLIAINNGEQIDLRLISREIVDKHLVYKKNSKGETVGKLEFATFKTLGESVEIFHA